MKNMCRERPTESVSPPYTTAYDFSLGNLLRRLRGPGPWDWTSRPQILCFRGDGAWRYKYEDGRTIWKGLHNTLVEILSQVGDKSVKTMLLGKEADSWAIILTTESGKCKCFGNNIPTELEDIITTRREWLWFVYKLLKEHCFAHKYFIQDIALNPWDSRLWWACFSDGNYWGDLPKAWQWHNPDGYMYRTYRTNQIPKFCPNTRSLLKGFRWLQFPFGAE